MTDKPREPQVIVTILLTGRELEQRSFTFDTETLAMSVSDWLSGNGVTNTRMSKRAYDIIIKSRNERINPLDRNNRLSNPEAVAYCPFCRKEHPGGATCLGHYP
jgi:hypothetical protein